MKKALFALALTGVLLAGAAIEIKFSPAMPEDVSMAAAGEVNSQTWGVARLPGTPFGQHSE